MAATELPKAREGLDACREVIFAETMMKMNSPVKEKPQH